MTAVFKMLTLKVPSKICSRGHSNFFFFFSEKTSLDILSESSAKQMIHMKCRDLFSLKKKKLLSAAVVIGAFRVKCLHIQTDCLLVQLLSHY